jgi:hypothetical protein
MMPVLGQPGSSWLDGCSVGERCATETLELGERERPWMSQVGQVGKMTTGNVDDMAFAVTWFRDGKPEVFLDERLRHEVTDGGVLNIYSTESSELVEQYSPQAWFSVQPYAAKVDPQQPTQQPPFGRLAGGPGLNYRGARQ